MNRKAMAATMSRICAACECRFIVVAPPKQGSVDIISHFVVLWSG
jgi:hypothetical protein